MAAQKNKKGSVCSAISSLRRAAGYGRQIAARPSSVILPLHYQDGRHLSGLQSVAAAQSEPSTVYLQPQELRSLASKGGTTSAAAAPRAADAGAAAVAVQEKGVEERLDAARPDAADAVAAAAQRPRALGAEPAARAAAGAGASRVRAAASHGTCRKRDIQQLPLSSSYLED